ncbi:ATP synthase F1 subunit delta [Desulforhabdus amnigena]|uniref:ATP synthase subunit delta n=1 Tax=Desulforhabdus amnigena TaxID=40218 RepID=A0A9W6FVI3_9BACT|nr:ATP synthase F1 subunit delta [Desulforhabdus amnigena]NLJ28526.1 ATP synthase F1 subunit delta [Deltaproteobacteria bacterium]GLI35613.1 ATP synthase subunit delta [Desulforhabdus amnigena]
MRNLVIAKRYAKALFNLALDGGWVGQYGRELDGFVQLLGELPDFADAVQNPLYPEAARKALFYSVADKAEMTPIMKSFINLLIEKKRVQHIGDIADYYHKLIDDHDNVARAQLKAATQLDEPVIQEIAQTLENMTGKKIVVEFQLDPTLIGGVVAQIGDLVLDGSVRRQLLNFKETLKRGALG